MATETALERHRRHRAEDRAARQAILEPYCQINTLRNTIATHLSAQKLAPEFRDALETADAALKNLAKFF